MQGDNDVFPLRQGQVLDDEGVHAGILCRAHQSVDLLQFPVIYDRIDCQEDARPETMGVSTKPRDVLEAVARRLAGAEPRPRDINGIGTAVDGCDADICRSGGSQKFKGNHLLEGV